MDEEKIEIVPAILEREWDKIKNKIFLVEKDFSWVQIDISDGYFTPKVTWDEPQDLEEIKTPIKIEVHLMIERPWKFIEKWLESSVSRIIVHYESFPPNETSFRDIKAFIQKVRKSGKEIGLALNVGTPIRLVEEFIPLLDMILFLAVRPGFGGQEFYEPVLEKISSLRSKFSDIKIGVDGGVNPVLANELVRAGANYLISGSYVFSHVNPSQALKEYQNEIANL